MFFDTFLVTYRNRQDQKRHVKFQTFGDKQGQIFQGFFVGASTYSEGVEAFKQRCVEEKIFVHLADFSITMVVDQFHFWSEYGNISVSLLETGELIKMLKVPTSPEYGRHFRDWLYEPWTKE